MTPYIIEGTVTREKLRELAKEYHRPLVKAVVDIAREIVAVGGEMHADEESLLLSNGSRQEDLWGINLWPDEPSDQWVEFDSMINLRPGQNNNSRGVEDEVLRMKIFAIVRKIVTP